MNYMVRLLPNNMVLIINQETRERKVLNPRDVSKFFQEELEQPIQNWDDKWDGFESFDAFQDELSKL